MDIEQGIFGFDLRWSLLMLGAEWGKSVSHGVVWLCSSSSNNHVRTGWHMVWLLLGHSFEEAHVDLLLVTHVCLAFSFCRRRRTLANGRSVRRNARFSCIHLVRMNVKQAHAFGWNWQLSTVYFSSEHGRFGHNILGVHLVIHRHCKIIVFDWNASIITAMYFASFLAIIVVKTLIKTWQFVVMTLIWFGWLQLKEIIGQFSGLADLTRIAISWFHC